MASNDRTDFGNERDKVTAPDAHPDAITGAPGSHPVGTGVGAAAAGAAGAALGTAVFPVAGTVVGGIVGAVVGAVGGGLMGKGVAEAINPTAEDAYWRDQHRNRPYYQSDYTYEDDYAPAYRYGWQSRDQYADRSFDDAEPALRQDWEKVKSRSRMGWDKARDATRDAWNRLDTTRGAAASAAGSSPSSTTWPSTVSGTGNSAPSPSLTSAVAGVTGQTGRGYDQIADDYGANTAAHVGQNNIIDDTTHPVGTAVGATGGGITGAIAGAAIGTAIFPGVGTAIGTVIGGVAGALGGGAAGHAAAEVVNPSEEDDYWREISRSRPYYRAEFDYDRDYAPAYRYGWQSRANLQWRGRSFDAVEPDLARDWDRLKGNSQLTWAQAREATRDAWTRIETAEPS